MGFRLKTSKKTKTIFEEIGASTNLKPFVLCKIAIALSLKSEQKIEDYHSDTLGLELQRPTVTGEHDALYKCMLEIYSDKHLSDEEYFPEYIKLHIDRGAELLQSLHKYSGGGNLEKFLNQLIHKGDVSI